MQFKNGFKRVTAVVLSAALAFAPAMTSFAADDTTQGVGNILAYNIETVVVPTAIKLVINPNGYSINTKYVEVASDATFGATTKYYYKSDAGVYSVATDVTSTNWSTKLAGGLYTAVQKTDQIVSFNYGIASKATRDKTVTVRFDATADSEIEFVDEADKVAAKSGDTDTKGAPMDSHRIFLNLVPAKTGTTITAETKVDSTTAFASTVKYYKTDATGAYVIDTSITDADTLAAAKDAYKVYEDGTAIGKYIRASELADVTMTGSDADKVINFAGTEGKAKADVAYMLYHATYDVKADEIIDWDTSYDGIEDKFELTSIAEVSTASGSAHNGGYSGFTFTGSMNTNTDWSELTTRTITIKPTYEIVNATGSEEAVESGLNQVKAGERTVVTPTAAYAGVENFGGTYVLLTKPSSSTTFTGLTAVSGISSYKLKYNNGEFVNALDKAMVHEEMVGITYSDAAAKLGFDALSAGDKITIQVTIGGTTYEAVFTNP